MVANSWDHPLHKHSSRKVGKKLWNSLLTQEYRGEQFLNNSDVPDDIMSSDNLLDTCKDHFWSNVKNKENTVLYTLSDGKNNLKDNKATFQQIRTEQKWNLRI